MQIFRLRTSFAIIMCGPVPAVAAAPAMLPTNLPGVFSYPSPPVGFDPIHASDGDLRAYGFPPRPNRLRSQRAYDGWARMVHAARVRIDPILSQAGARHLPMIAAGGTRAQSNTEYSNNWSGDILTSGATNFGSNSFYTLWGEFNVPIAQAPFGSCGSIWYSATWIGMDGYNGTPDLVQAGTESDTTCYDGSNAGTYYAWYEWYPAYTQKIDNLPVSPGDDIGVQVGVSNSTSASVFITNETTNQYAAIGFSAPQGSHFIGNSAEWILERPEVNKNLTSLQNYVTDYMSNTLALLDDGSNAPVFAGIGKPGIPSNTIEMLDKNSNPLSIPLIWGGGGLVYHDAGAAK
jgi:hypothetical protein